MTIPAAQWKCKRDYITATYLLGLIHGHFLVQPNAGDGENTIEDTNAGVAIVVPVESIFSVINEYENKPG